MPRACSSLMPKFHQNNYVVSCFYWHFGVFCMTTRSHVLHFESLTCAGLGGTSVYITDQNVRETSPEGKAKVTQHKAADYSSSGPSKQKADNLTDKPFEAVVVELKTIY